MKPLTAREALGDVRLMTTACRLERGDSLRSVAGGLGISANALRDYCRSRGWDVIYRAPHLSVFLAIEEMIDRRSWPVEMREAWNDYIEGRVRTLCRFARVAREHGYEWRRVPAQRGLYRGDSLLLDSLPPEWRVHRGHAACCDAFDPRCHAVIEFRNSRFCAACAAGILRHEANWP